jgi:hypothetical protein
MQGNNAGRVKRRRLEQHPKPYLVVLRGELGERFAPEFEGMILESRGGKTFLKGVIDQVQLHGILEQAQQYNLEIIEVAENPADLWENVAGGNRESQGGR